jgi:hypothetical protein
VAGVTRPLPVHVPLPQREIPGLPISYFFPGEPLMTFDAPYEALGWTLAVSNSNTGAYWSC